MTTINDDIEESKENIKLVAATSVSFERKNDLVRVSKRCNKSVDSALSFLEGVVSDPDADLKQKIDCAKFIVTMTKELSESIARDQLQRAISQSRLLLAQQATMQKRIKQVDDDDSDAPVTPIYSPNIIHDVSTIKEM